jgi:hypothetical protein
LELIGESCIKSRALVPFSNSKLGLMDTARHVVGRNLIQETKV